MARSPKGRGGSRTFTSLLFVFRLDKTYDPLLETSSDGILHHYLLPYLPKIWSRYSSLLLFGFRPLPSDHHTFTDSPDPLDTLVRHSGRGGVFHSPDGLRCVRHSTILFPSPRRRRTVREDPGPVGTDPRPTVTGPRDRLTLSDRTK